MMRDFLDILLWGLVLGMILGVLAHTDTLDDHERRLTLLESRPACACAAEEKR